MWKQWLVARDSPRQRAVAIWTRKVEIHDVSARVDLTSIVLSSLGQKSEEATFYKVGGHEHPLEPGWWRTAELELEPTTLPPLLLMFSGYTRNDRNHITKSPGNIFKAHQMSLNHIRLKSFTEFLSFLSKTYTIFVLCVSLTTVG